MSPQNDLYREASTAYAEALDRLARAYEADPEKRRDLLQDIQLALWRSFERFEGKCSMRTWVYRVAHNTATTHIIRQRRSRSRHWMSLEEVAALPHQDGVRDTEQRMEVDRLMQLIHGLKPLDRQIMLLYLEDLDSGAIGEITGLSPGHVRIQIHRIKAILSLRFHEGGRNDG